MDSSGKFCGFVFQDNVNSLLPVFEEFLKNAPNDASYDAVRQSVVILMGSLAKHLDKSDPKVKPIVGKLIAALSTPSQQVGAALEEFSGSMQRQVNTVILSGMSERWKMALVTESCHCGCSLGGSYVGDEYLVI